MRRFASLARAALLILVTFAPQPATSQARVNDQIIAANRRECERKGGTYSHPRCILPPTGDRPDAAVSPPVGHIFQRNYGSCAYDLLIAYVPKGSTGYVVDEWWNIATSSWGALKDDNDRYLVHDANHPPYFYGQKKNGQKFRGDRHDRTFEFSGRSYPFTRVANGLYQGKFWIEINC